MGVALITNYCLDCSHEIGVVMCCSPDDHGPSPASIHTHEQYLGYVAPGGGVACFPTKIAMEMTSQVLIAVPKIHINKKKRGKTEHCILSSRDEVAFDKKSHLEMK